MLIISLQAKATCRVIDDKGNLIELEKKANRIISLTPDITETLFAIGAGKQIVGVIKGSDYPKEANNIKQVGSYAGVDIETIMSLKPDLIISWNQAFSRQMTVLKKLGIPIYLTEPKQLEDIPHTMKNLGCLTGHEKQAMQSANIFLSELNQMSNTYQNKKTIRVFYQIGSYSLMTINENNWINQVITRCGGQNVFAHAKSIAPEIGWEAIFDVNPDVVIKSATDEHWKLTWSRWPELTAVNHHYLFSIHPDLIERAGPRLIEGVKQMCNYLNVARIGKNSYEYP